MIFRSKEMKTTNMNPKTKMLKLKIMAAMMILMMSFSGIKKLETYAILIVVLWI